MASWGREAETVLTGTASIANTDTTVVGSNTEFLSEVSVKDLVSIGGQVFIVTSVVDDEELEVTPAAVGAESDENVLLSQVPKFLNVTDARTKAVYVTVEDAQDANTRADGIKTPGWTLYEEYGTGRKRVETLVAMKSTS